MPWSLILLFLLLPYLLVILPYLLLVYQTVILPVFLVSLPVFLVSLPSYTVLQLLLFAFEDQVRPTAAQPFPACIFAPILP